MERMIVAVFDNETKAYEGKSALSQLEREGSITVYAGAVVTKNADGTTSVKQYDDFGPVGSLVGTTVGSLIGLLGGPVGWAVGATSGLALGALYDVDNALVGEDFVEDVLTSLKPKKVAVVAEIEEEWTTPVDTRMEALGGKVFRRSLREHLKSMHDEDVAAMKADLAAIKAEISKAHADRKAKLQKKVDELKAKIEAQEKKAKESREAFAERQKTKRALLKKNAAAAGRAIKELARTPV
jgi:uncharacterized membrane protein